MTTEQEKLRAANECSRCGRQIATSLCGFEKLDDGSTRLYCLPCKSARDAEKVRELAEEFAENGLDDVAEYVRENGIVATREWIEGVIAEAREDDRLYHHGEGWTLPNLEVARERLETA